MSELQRQLLPTVEKSCDLTDVVNVDSDIGTELSTRSGQMPPPPPTSIARESKYTIGNIILSQLVWDAATSVVIGRGGFAIVFSGLYCGHSVAVKQLQLQTNPTAKELKKFRREARIAQMAAHPNIIGFLGANIDMRIIVIELAHCSLADIVFGSVLLPNGSSIAHMAEIMSVLQDICNGLEILHYHGIVHRQVGYLWCDQYGRIV